MAERISPRDVLNDVLTDLGSKNQKLVVVDADYCTASKTTAFRRRFPERFIQVGIAEQNMMGVAAGLATVGLIPFVSTLATFCSRRACDQVVTSIALPRLNVKILAVYTGLFVGKNGATHQALEDLAIMRAIPDMTVIQPADAAETEQVLRFAAGFDGPMYIRIARDTFPVLVPAGYQFQLGKALTLQEGKDLTIITAGEVVEDVLAAGTLLKNENIRPRIINMSSIKPIDQEAIIKAAGETGRIMTVENHNILAGLGSAVAEVVTEFCPVKVKRLGVRDVFGKSGTNDQMKRKFGLRAEDIYEEALKFISA